jgi:RNA polymerase sigma-70 factor, ECF subfamily
MLSYKMHDWHETGSPYYQHMDDQTLIEKIRQRDQEAMVTLHARYANLIYSIAFRVLNDGLSAEEATQDAFMKAWQNAAQFDGTRGSLVAWLVGIARNLAIDKLRQRARQVVIAENEIGDSDGVDLFNLPDDWQNRDRLNSLKFAVQNLPTDQRVVIELSYYGGMSQSDIAESLKLPLGTVKTRMRLGMQKLRAAWLNER